MIWWSNFEEKYKDYGSGKNEQEKKYCIFANDHWSRGKVMSQKANKLQAPILDNLIYSRRPFLKKVINSSEMTINSCER